MIALRRQKLTAIDSDRPSGSVVDRRIETTASYLPNATGELLVLAHCMEHFINQPKADMHAGVIARCSLSSCAPTRVCKTCVVEKKQESFALSKGSCRKTTCKTCLNDAYHASK